MPKPRNRYVKMPFISLGQFGVWIEERRPIYWGHKYYCYAWYCNWPVKQLFMRTLRMEDQVYMAVPAFKCEVCDHIIDKRRMSRVQDVCADCEAKGDRGALE
jgi:hypothetical protein